jgi:4-amino-4-deoxy-L-arabinose transferase-like glycosyltransferase
VVSATDASTVTRDGAARAALAGLTSARTIALAAPLVVAAIVIVNAWSGLMPGVGFWDTGEFQAVLPVMGTAHPTGYPTYVLVGFVANLLLAPIGEPAFRVTVLSLLAVAVAAGATAALVRRLTGSTIIGVAAGLGLALTPLVWQNATRADPHAIHLAFVAILLLALVRWADGRTDGLDRRTVDRRLVIAAVVFGLSAGNHSLTLLLVPPIALYVLAVEPGILRRPLFIAACVVAAVLAVALVYLELPIRGGLLPAPLVYGKPATWDGFWYIALAEQFRGSVGNVFANLPGKLDDLVRRTSLELGPLALAILPAFIVTARSAPRYALLTGSAMVITLLFNQSYANADIGRYYLGPVLWIWTWLGIFAAEVVVLVVTLLGERGGARGVAARPIALLAAAIVAIVLLLPAIADVDTRRHAADRSGDTAAVRWLAETLPKLEPDAVVVSWWTTSTPLWYAQKVQGLRQDLFVVDDRTMLDLGLGRAPDVIRRYLAEGRPTYAIRVEPNGDLAELTSQFDMTLVASGGSTGVWKVSGERVAIQ